MNAEPLVTVAMPCYNRAASLPMALASLVAQTYPAWECVLVDDGSTDNSVEVAASLHDPRIRIVHLPRHMGRGAARQAALDAARGDLFSLLDTDDWLYPDKLARQVAVMAQLPKAGVVGSGIAVVDAAHQLVGVRGRGAAEGSPQLLPPVQGTLPLPLARVPLMMRTHLARQCRYDPRLRRAEDADFVLQLLARTRYCVLPDLTYAYRQEQAAAVMDNLSAYLYRMRVIWKHRARSYGDAARQFAITGAKGVCYGLGSLMGAGEWLIRRRSQPATPAEVVEFVRARRVVMAERQRLFDLPIHLPPAQPVPREELRHEGRAHHDH